MRNGGAILMVFGLSLGLVVGVLVFLGLRSRIFSSEDTQQTMALIFVLNGVIFTLLALWSALSLINPRFGKAMLGNMHPSLFNDPAERRVAKQSTFALSLGYALIGISTFFQAFIVGVEGPIRLEIAFTILYSVLVILFIICMIASLRLRQRLLSGRENSKEN